MSTNFRDVIDKPDWRIIAPFLNASSAGGSIAFDEQDSDDRYLGIFHLISNTVLNFYNTVNDWPSFVGSPWLAWTFGAGANAVFMPSAWPRWTIASGATTNSITPSATIGASIPQNRLASRGLVWLWFKIRVIDNGAGWSGKTEERRIIANTAGTTPKIVLDSPLTFTPVVWSSYEILSGRIFLLWAGTLVAGAFKYFDIALWVFSGNLSITNLPVIGTDSQMVVLDETYNPSNKNSYEWMLWRITASAVNATTINSSTVIPNTFADATTWLPINYYRNFQIRIVEDATTPTAVGQRQIISSHTAGANPVFTIYSAWTVQPSNTAKFVVEYPNEIIFRTASTSTFSYAPYQVRNNSVLTTAGTQADTWSAVRYWVSSTAGSAWIMMFTPFAFPQWDLTKDPLLTFRASEIFQFRGGSTALDVLDIAGGATGLWTNGASYLWLWTTFGAGSTIAYDPIWEDGKFAYINLNGTQFFYRFNMFTRDIWEYAYMRQSQGTAVAGWRMYSTHWKDKNGDKVSAIGHLQCSGLLHHECWITT